MKSLLHGVAVALVIGAVFIASQPKQASAQVPYSVTYTYRVPTTVYYAPPPVVSVARPTVVYSPVIAAPAPVYSAYSPPVSYGYGYVPPSATVVQYRGPLGIFPRRAVVYSSGGVYAPAPAVVYPGW